MLMHFLEQMKTQNHFILTIFLSFFLLHTTPLHAMTLEQSLSVNTLTITLSGVIEPGDDRLVAQALIDAKRTNINIIVILDSRGGDVDVAMSMGKLFRRNLVTTINKTCGSSCIFAYAGGARRVSFISKGRPEYYFNLHRPELGDALAETNSPFAQQMMGMLKNYLQIMLGNDALYDLMMTVPFSSLHAMQLSEIRTANLVTDFKEQ